MTKRRVTVRWRVPADAERRRRVLVDVLGRSVAMGKKLQELRDLCAENIEIIGVLAEMAGVLEEKATLQALDNNHAAAHALPLPHKTLLPFEPKKASVPASTSCGVTVFQLREATGVT